MWLTKDTAMPEPIQISTEKEQGSYAFWDPRTWDKLRVSLKKMSVTAMIDFANLMSRYLISSCITTC